MRIITPIILMGFITLVAVTINHRSRINNLDLFSNNSHNIINIKDLKQIDPKNETYQFLLASIAFNRKQMELAKKTFKNLLDTTKNPIIAEILTEIATETEDLELLKFATNSWSSLDLKNSNAHLTATLAWLESEQTVMLENFLQKAILTNPQKIDLHLSSILTILPETQRTILLRLLQSLAKKNAKNPINQLCLAQIAAQLGDLTLAQQANNTALKLTPYLTNAIFLQAKLIRSNSISDLSALTYLKQQITKYPANEELLLFYANALADNEYNIESLSIVKKLFNTKNQDLQLEANLLAAELYLQKPTLNINKAKQCLNKLIKEDLANNKVFFILAQINESQGESQEAIRLYTSIMEEPYHLVSFFRAALLLANDNQLDHAIEILNNTKPTNLLEQKQLLLFKIELALELKDLSLAITDANQGLSIFPNDIDLLYAHSIIASLNNQILVAEKDLKHIIEIQPENHNALNALGFLMIHDHKRQEEAFYYIQKALSLSPNNPAYMDSMGLLLFHMGKIPDSLEMLTNAYKLSNSFKIAIHLGEVLWANGEEKQATIFLEKAWKTDPTNEELVNILNKYKITFLKANN